MVFVSADVELTGLPVAESNLAPPSAWVACLHALGEVGKKNTNATFAASGRIGNVIGNHTPTACTFIVAGKFANMEVSF